MPESKFSTHDLTCSSSNPSSSASIAPSGPYIPPHLRNKEQNISRYGNEGGSNTVGAKYQNETNGLVRKNDSYQSSNSNYYNRGNDMNRGNRYTPGERLNDRWRMNESNNDDRRGFTGNSSGGFRSMNNSMSNSSNYNMNNRGFMNRTKCSTGWESRDNRRHNFENESTIFSSVSTKTTGVNFDMYESIPVELTGKGAECITPLESFQEAQGVHPLLMSNVKRVNYARPTPVQKYAIPAIFARRDLMACAQTGSGKTAAFLFPIITLMITDGPPPNATYVRSYSIKPSFPICLVLSPTRELAVQIYEEAKKFQFGTGIRTVCLYGGSDVKLQLIDLDRGCDVCVATPGRLTDLVERKRVNLSLVKYLVLDEADRMLDMGFAPQIRLIVEDKNMPSGKEGRQTVMFSATFPREIQHMARDFLHDYLYLAVGRVGSTNDFICQRLIYADDDQKPKHLVKLLREQDKGLTIIFVETKKKVDLIESYLMNDNFRAVSIHGDRLQHERERALKLFKSGEYPILVATDVAARGLDISNITHVINCDLPTNIDDYVHRIGRTGRAGNMGIATSFVNEGNRQVLRRLLELLQEANQEIPQWFQSLVMSTSASSSRLGGNDFSIRSGGRYGSNNNLNNRGGGRGGFDNNNSFYAGKSDNSQNSRYNKTYTQEDYTDSKGNKNNATTSFSYPERDDGW